MELNFFYLTIYKHSSWDICITLLIFCSVYQLNFVNHAPNSMIADLWNILVVVMVIDLCIFLFSTDTYKTHKWLLFLICGNEKGFLLYLFSLFTNCKGPFWFLGKWIRSTIMSCLILKHREFIKKLGEIKKK